MSPALKAIWVPILLALTVMLAFFEYCTFGFLPFLQCLFVTLGHFYPTHFLAAKYFAIHNPVKGAYWRIVSIAYIPFILSFWVLFLVHGPMENSIDFSGLEHLVSGLLLSIILFAILSIKKLKMDLDALMALIFVIAIVGVISALLLCWLMAKIFS